LRTIKKQEVKIMTKQKAENNHEARRPGTLAVECVAHPLETLLLAQPPCLLRARYSAFAAIESLYWDLIQKPEIFFKTPRAKLRFPPG
jgi:hypothetical protein